MSYQPKEWSSTTPITVSSLNHIESGISEAHEAISEVNEAITETNSKVEQIAGGQIPEEYVQEAVEEYVNNNSGGFATKTELNTLDSKLSSEIDNVESELKENIEMLDTNVFDYDSELVKESYDSDLTIENSLYINQWRIESGSFNILIFPIESGALYNMQAQFTFGNAKTFMLLKNLNNDGTGKMVDENEIANETRTVTYENVDTTGYNYIACSVPPSINHMVTVEKVVTIKKPKIRPVLYVGASRKITKFSDGVLQAMSIGNCDLYVDSGTYDLIAEIGEELMSTDLRYKYGLRIGNGVRVFFSSGAKVVCNYTGNNESINTLFCILYGSSTDYEIHNADFECSNVRYVVHDEADGIGTYTHLYRDCVMKLDNTNNTNWVSKQCIGGGLGEYATIIVDGGYYHSVGIDDTSDKGVITYHNPMSGKGTEFKNKVTIKNVYFEEGTCYVSSLGDSTKISEFYCCDCSVKMLPYANGTTNVKCIQWNNEVRE